MKFRLNAVTKVIRIALGALLVFVSLWALLLPPAFPYSAYAVINAEAVPIKTLDRGQITYAPINRSTILQVDDRVATVERDLAKVQRELEEQKFTKQKLEGQLKSLNKVVVGLQRKQQGAKSELKEKRISSGVNLQSFLEAAKEKVQIFKADLAEKTADQERVKPLFDDGIVTAAQWSDTRKLKIEAEKLLKVTEEEFADIKARLEDYRRGGSGMSEEKDAILMTKVEAYEQDMGKLGIQQAQLRTELEALQKQINSARDYNRSDLTYELTTPIEGIVWHRHAVSGELLGDEQVVAEIADISSLFVEAYFRRDFLNQITIGDHASIYLLKDTRFINGRVANVRVQESSVRGARIINTAGLDKTLLVVKIMAEDGEIIPKDIGELSKVLISSGQPSWFERSRIWLSLLLRSHKNQ